MYDLTMHKVSATSLADVILTGAVVELKKDEYTNPSYTVTVSVDTKIQLLKIMEALTREHKPNRVIRVMDLGGY